MAVHSVPWKVQWCCEACRPPTVCVSGILSPAIDGINPDASMAGRALA
jgi:hypothetical protein